MFNNVGLMSNYACFMYHVSISRFNYACCMNHFARCSVLYGYNLLASGNLFPFPVIIPTALLLAGQVPFCAVPYKARLLLKKVHRIEKKPNVIP